MPPAAFGILASEPPCGSAALGRTLTFPASVQSLQSRALGDLRLGMEQIQDRSDMSSSMRRTHVPDAEFGTNVTATNSGAKGFGSPLV